MEIEILSQTIYIKTLDLDKDYFALVSLNLLDLKQLIS